MKKIIVPFGFLALAASSVQAGWGYPARLAACEAAATICPGICHAACFEVCLPSLAAFCFSENMQVYRKLPSGEIETVQVSELKHNDTVKSLNHENLSEETWIKVIDSKEHKGSFDFRRFHFEESNDLFEVTNNHLLMKHKLNETNNDDFDIQFAVQFNVGDKMMVNGLPSKIVKIEDYSGAKKYEVNTVEGSLIVNEVFTAGLCDNVEGVVNKLKNKNLSWVDFLSFHKKTHDIFE